MKRRYLKRLIGHRLVVHTSDDQSIRGVLTVVASDALVLEAPEYLDKGQEATDMNGRAGVLLSNVAFWQEI